MKRLPRAAAALAAAVLLVLAAAGCVERRMTLVTEPEGAKAYYNGEYVGETPVTFHFTHYGSPRLEFEKDGYERLDVVREVRAPLYQRFPLDFFAEVLWPGTIYDRHTFTFELAESKLADRERLKARAAELERETLGE